jgi:hypothetical protein
LDASRRTERRLERNADLRTQHGGIVDVAAAVDRITYWKSGAT